jgi:hypothetical protein
LRLADASPCEHFQRQNKQRQPRGGVDERGVSEVRDEEAAHAESRNAFHDLTSANSNAGGYHNINCESPTAGNPPHTDASHHTRRA